MQAGEHITSKIKLVRPLGQGAMGFVWEAQHLGLGAKVAVKLMSPALQDDARFIERFRQEARAAAQLSSPHVVKVLEHGVADGGEPYIVMELLEGETLRSRLERVGALPLVDVLTIVRQTTQALTAAHGAGVVHRDIKPDNLFLTKVLGKPFVKVLDFGIAKLAQPEGVDMTTTGRTLGTPLYMSPEQFISTKSVDHRSDLWSLGVVAYHALTGRLPFEGETMGALALAVHTAQIKPLSAIKWGLPEAVDAWMKRALQRDPAERFQSAMTMGSALMTAAEDVDGGPEQARRGNPEGRREAVIDAAAQKRPSNTPVPAAEPPRIDEPGSAPRTMFQLDRGRVEIAEEIPPGVWNVTTEAVLCPWFRSVTTAEGYQMLKIGGSRLREEMRGDFLTTFQWDMAPGEVRLTSAGEVPPPTRFIVHLGISSTSQIGYSLSSLLYRDSWFRRALRRAEGRGIKSLACLPFYSQLSQGETERVAEAVLEDAVKYLSSARSMEHIAFVPYSSSDRRIWTSVLNRMMRGR